MPDLDPIDLGQLMRDGILIDPETGIVSYRSRPETTKPRARYGELPTGVTPPLRRHQEARSGAQWDISDAVADKTGNAVTAKNIDDVVNFSKNYATAGASLTGAPLLSYGAKKIDQLSDSAAAGYDSLGGLLVSEAQAQGTPKPDPFAELEPFKEQRKDLNEQLQQAKKQREMELPKDGRLPNPNARDKKGDRTFPRYWTADETVQRLQKQIGDIDDKISKLTPILEQRAGRLAGEQKEQDRLDSIKLGGERLADAKRNRTPWEKVVQDDAGALGFVGGMTVGHVLRQGAPFVGQMLPKYFGGGYRRMKSAQDAENLRADHLLTPGSDWSRRAGNVNTVATEGKPLTLWDRVRGNKSEVPFEQADKTKAGIAYNPNAPRSADLYDRGDKTTNFLKDAVAGGALGATESTIMHFTLVADAKEEMDRAQAKFNDNPTPENVKSLMDAKHNYGFWRAFEVGGRSFAGGYATAAGLHPAPRNRPARIGEYDAEVKRIREWIDKTNKAKRGKGGGSPPSPPPGGPQGGGGAAPQAPAPAAPAPQPGAGALVQTQASQATQQPPPGMVIPEGHTWAGPSNPTQTRVGGKYGPKAESKESDEPVKDRNIRTGSLTRGEDQIDLASLLRYSDR